LSVEFLSVFESMLLDWVLGFFDILVLQLRYISDIQAFAQPVASFN